MKFEKPLWTLHWPPHNFKKLNQLVFSLFACELRPFTFYHLITIESIFIWLIWICICHFMKLVDNSFVLYKISQIACIKLIDADFVCVCVRYLCLICWLECVCFSDDVCLCCSSNCCCCRFCWYNCWCGCIIIIIRSRPFLCWFVWFSRAFVYKSPVLWIQSRIAEFSGYAALLHVSRIQAYIWFDML